MHWIAFLDGNETLPQNRDDGTENRYIDIPRDRLQAFGVFQDDERPVLIAHIPKGARLIYRQRVEKRSDGLEIRVWLVGCQETKNGQNSQYVAVIFPDGHIQVVNGWQEGHRWFYPPELIPQEQ